MTLSHRIVFFKAGIVFCSVSVLFIIAASFISMPAFSSIDAAQMQRSTGIFQMFTTRLLRPNFYAVYASIAAAVLYSLITLCLIHYYFEKTQSPEILFIGLFVMSLACESIRLIFPLRQIGGIPSFYLLLVSRTLLFGRYFGLFSLFAASLCAVGLEAQKQRMFIVIGAVTALIIALGTPIDTFSWSTNFNTIYGYDSMFRMINIAVLIITVVSFLIAAYVRGSREYIFIGIGIFLVLAGRGILLNTDTWAGVPGIVPLAVGAWFICNYLHKVYLWL